MKELRHNMRLIGALVVVAFVGLSAWFALTVFEQGGIWASTSYNTRLNASGAFRGDILDRNGTTLATTVDGQRVELSKNEGRILHMLLEHKGQAVTRDALMVRLWESDSFVDENTLNVNVGRLRRKLEAAGLTDFIRTRKGVGYLVED